MEDVLPAVERSLVLVPGGWPIVTAFPATCREVIA
jgi:hypothetical protein